MAAQQVIAQLLELDDASRLDVITAVLRAHPDPASDVVNICIPDLTYAPLKCLKERRATGNVG